MYPHKGWKQANNMNYRFVLHELGILFYFIPVADGISLKSEKATMETHMNIKEKSLLIARNIFDVLGREERPHG